jgi:putative transcriptional regulator
MNKSLVEARKSFNLTITEAAKRIGISHGMLAMLETRKRSGSDDTKIKVAKFYDKSIEDLFYNY